MVECSIPDTNAVITKHTARKTVYQKKKFRPGQKLQPFNCLKNNSTGAETLTAYASKPPPKKKQQLHIFSGGSVQFYFMGERG